MEIGIVYFSKTGNTEKLARAIGQEMKLKPVKVENCRKPNFDFVFIGSGTYGMKPAPEIIEFLDKVQAKYAAVFETHAGMGCSDWMEKKLQSRGITVIGRFCCSGEFPVWGSFILNKGKPNEQDLFDAKHFAKLMKNKLKHPSLKIP